MKLKYATILCASILIAPFMSEAKSTLFKKGGTNYSIVIPKNASISERTAAKELSFYLNEISRAEFNVTEEDSDDRKSYQIFVGFNEEYANRCNVVKPAADDEGYTYRNVGKDLWIYGGSTRGTMYGVYSFLENELGVRWYATDCTKIPKCARWDFDELNVSETPAIRYRFTQYRNVENDHAWLAHNKNNSVWTACNNQYGGLSAYWNAHTFELFVPSAKYFQQHPNLLGWKKNTENA